MARPILFISHSAYGDEAAQRTLAGLQQALEADFEILLDRDRLQGGDDWRAYLHTWMGNCDGAILLLSEKALRSPWVLKESTILLWRWSLSPASERFPVVPVLVGISREAPVQCAQFRPLDLAALKPLAASDKSLVERIKEAFRPIRERRVGSARHSLALKIANNLQDVSSALLDRVATALGEDLGGWDPDCTNAEKVAMLLLQATFARLSDALGPLHNAIPRHGMENLVALLKPTWLAADTAASFQFVASRAGIRGASLNATKATFTVPDLIDRAVAAEQIWPYCLLSGYSGEDDTGALLSGVREWLRKNGENVDDLDDASVRAFLAQPRTPPLIIVLAPSVTANRSPSGATLTRFRNDFQHCIFLVLTGENLAAIPGLTQLTPVLEAGVESAAYNDWLALKMAIGIGRRL